VRLKVRLPAFRRVSVELLVPDGGQGAAGVEHGLGSTNAFSNEHVETFKLFAFPSGHAATMCRVEETPPHTPVIVPAGRQNAR